MTRWRLLLHSAMHYWRTHLGTVLGVTVATMVLVGALAVGDSVRYSLQVKAVERIGSVDFVLPGADRFVTSELAGRLQDSLNARVAAAIQLRGTAATADGSRRARDVQMLGIDDAFFELGSEAQQQSISIQPGEVALNAELAKKLDVNVGDVVVLRVEQPSAMPRESVLGKTEDITTALRVKVAGIVTAESFGNFSMHGSSITASNAFISREWLESSFDGISGANLLLVGSVSTESTVSQLDDAIRNDWSLADLGLSIRSVNDWKEPIELRSTRIFIDQPIVDAVAAALPHVDGIITYFVNTIAANGRETPYSMVTSFGELQELLSNDLSEKSTNKKPMTIVNRWLADDLDLKVGQSIDLRYFLIDEKNELVEEATSLEVSEIVAIKGEFADATLMPDFPGITDAESSREWESDLPIDLGRIREKDETYWDDFRGTPKVFFTPLSRAVSMWSNRFGPLTSIRVAKEDADLLEATVLENVSPSSIGLAFIDVRTQSASTAATDFGGLFIGLSFFLIISSLILTTLLFVFGVEQRQDEIGLLLATGFRPTQVRNMLVMEGAVIAIVGAFIGAIAGMLYTRTILLGLTSIWEGAVGGTFLEFHASPATIVGGGVGSLVAAVFAMWWAIRKHVKKSPKQLLQHELGDDEAVQQHRGTAPTSRVVAIVFSTIAVGCTIAAVLLGELSVVLFFASGTLLLIAGLLWSRCWLMNLGRDREATDFTRFSITRRNTSRRLGRSLATIILLACGVFLIVTVAANRIGSGGDPDARSSGTGGFALFAESTLPIPRDLSTNSGQTSMGFRNDELNSAEIVPIRVVAGDDASCLNLAIPTSPRLFGIDPFELATRNAFTFAETIDDTNSWEILHTELGPDVIPAIGDAASVRWTMHKSVGDDLEYIDGNGKPFQIRIVGTLKNSILQGVLIVDVNQLEMRFPNTGGDRAFLIDVDSADEIEQVQSTMNRQLSDVGFAATSTVERLAAFNEVQNTYLAIFQMLGGLGLVLGTMGLGMVVLRNTLERRQELAVMQAIGFRKAAISRLIRREHALLLMLGLLVGTISAVTASLPSIVSGASDIFNSLLVTLAILMAMLVVGLCSVFVATRFAIGGPLLTALRSE